MDQVMQSAEAQREMAEYLAPRMQQFMSDIQTVADAFNRAMEPYRELGRQMAKVMQVYRQQAEQVGRAIRMAQPYLDAINREIERRNAIYGTAKVVSADIVVDVEPIDVEVEESAIPTGKILAELHKKAEHLCGRVAFLKDEGYLFFQVPTGWAVEKIGNQEVTLITRYFLEQQLVQNTSNDNANE